MRKASDRNKSRKKKIGVLAMIFLLTIIGVGYQYKINIGPILDDISKIKSKGIITEIINQTIEEDLFAENYNEELFKVEKDNDGKIQMIQANTALINAVIAKFTKELQKQYNDIGERKVMIPYGTLLGSKAMSQTNFKLAIRVSPLAVSKCDFETDFVSEGINQTKYRVFLNIKSEVRVLQPFTSQNFTVSNKMLLAETMIIGEIPGSYVVVPEEDILDVTNE